MRLESSLKWPGYCNSWNTQVIRAELAQKWRPNPPTTKVYKRINFFHIFRFHCLGEIRVLISRSSDGSSLIFVTCRRGQVTIPWLKRLTDALASEPTLQIWPRGFSLKPGQVWQLDVYALLLRANATPRQRLETPGSLCTYPLLLRSAGTIADYVINYLF